MLTKANDAGRDNLVPPTKGGDNEVVETTHQTCYEKGLGLIASLGTAYQNLCGGSGLGEGVFAMHLLDKVFAEGDKEENANDTTKQGREEYLDERGGHLGVIGIFGLKDVDGWQCEDGSGNYCTRTGSDALDNHILAQGILPPGGCRGSHGNNGYRNGGLKHLTYLQS